MYAYEVQTAFSIWIIGVPVILNVVLTIWTNTIFRYMSFMFIEGDSILMLMIECNENMKEVRI